jgi:hypothetical protein
MVKTIVLFSLTSHEFAQITFDPTAYCPPIQGGILAEKAFIFFYSSKPPAKMKIKCRK